MSIKWFVAVIALAILALGYAASPDMAWAGTETVLQAAMNHHSAFVAGTETLL